MSRTLYAIKTDKGFLSDITKYTSDVHEAITFVSFEVAVRKASQLKDYKLRDCSVVPVELPFPRVTPLY